MLSQMDEGNDQDRDVKRGQDRREMHLRAGVGHHEIRNASVIPPPEDEERLDDDAGD